MFKKRFKPNWRKLFKWGLILAFLVLLPRIITTLTSIPYWNNIKAIEKIKSHEIAIVLAAETKPDGTPSAVLRDRIQAGIDLYHAGKAETLVMSGRSPEPEIMREYAVEQGVPAEAILLDNLGQRTYATCYQAANTFQFNQAIVVTQNYHLPRTIFLCRAMGIETTGVAAIHGNYWRGSTISWNIRETLATILAFKEIYLSPPTDVDYLTIPPQEDL